MATTKEMTPHMLIGNMLYKMKKTFFQYNDL